MDVEAIRTKRWLSDCLHVRRGRWTQSNFRFHASCVYAIGLLKEKSWPHQGLHSA